MASISKVKIANMALSHIGADSTIESFTENSTEALQVDLWYDWSRIQTLEAFDWSFARKRLALAEHSEDPPEGQWAFRYQYPADCIAFRHIANPFNRTFLDPNDLTESVITDAVPFELEMDSTDIAKTILTDMEDACGVYTFDQEITSTFTAHFIDALSYMLAHRLAMPITGKLSLRDKMLETWQYYINVAPAQNANERVGRPERDALWVRVRR
jgi:hypothetical protein